MFRDRELFQQAARFMLLRFGSHTNSTRLAIFLDEVVESWPSVFSLYSFDSLILTRVISKYVIMFIMKDIKSEVSRVGNVNEIIMS